MPGSNKKSYGAMNRRAFLQRSSLASLALALPGNNIAAARHLDQPVSLGLIADLHQDIMHDGPTRLQAFVDNMKGRDPDALIQMGDFAYPNAKNKEVIDLFNNAHDETLHVIGNHDTDSGHTRQQCFDIWGMPGRYYEKEILGLTLLVLDGNDKGSPTHKGGYPSYVGKEQQDWLNDRLSSGQGPFLIVSHQPLMGSAAVDNAAEIQEILSRSAEKILLAINGHTHIDSLLRNGQVAYLHINSASYKWVGGDYKHQMYSEEIHEKYPWISHTCPYTESLFAYLTIDPKNMSIKVEGRQAEWVGPSPAAIGSDPYPELVVGEQIAPHIRNHLIERIIQP